MSGHAPWSHNDLHASQESSVAAQLEDCVSREPYSRPLTWSHGARSLHQTTFWIRRTKNGSYPASHSALVWKMGRGKGIGSRASQFQWFSCMGLPKNYSGIAGARTWSRWSWGGATRIAARLETPTVKLRRKLRRPGRATICNFSGASLSNKETKVSLEKLRRPGRATICDFSGESLSNKETKVSPDKGWR